MMPDNLRQGHLECLILRGCIGPSQIETAFEMSVLNGVGGF